ncbi:MAG: hypothetical protein IJ447_02830 [Clostridia bacterium]|nr:hypothetical protein [Clostridia bacterium]
MKKTNKLISILLVLAMLLSMAPLSLTASAAPDTDYTGYYKITNAGNLAWFACLVVGDTSQSGITEAEPDAKAVLTADIDITVLGERLGKSWVGIGTEEIPFTGIFDGNGYTIKGLTTDTNLTKSAVATVPVDTAKQGLFGVIGEGGVVRDVIVEGTANLSDTIKYGGICSENNGTIENVLSMITVTGGDNADVFCNTNNGTITNSFANQTTSVASGVTTIDAAALADGSVTYALGASFGQTIGTDTQPVHFNGENTVYKDGDVYTNTKPDIPDLGEARIYDTSVNLGIDLSVKFYVEIGEDIEIENIRLRTVSPSGVLKDLPVDTDGTGNPLTVTKGIHTLYVFTLNGITPQCIGNTIEAQLYHNDIIMDCDNSGLNTSIKEILIGIYDSSDDNTKQLIIDTLDYGAASQVYRDYKTDALVTDGFEPATQDVDKEVPENKPVLTDDSSAVDIFTNVSYGATNYLMFGLSGNVDFTGKVTVNDAPVTGTMQGSYYVVKTETISAKDLGKDFTVKYTGDDGAVTLTYSINDYCYTAYTTSTNQKMIDLAQALYNYGLSAHIYSGEHELGNEQTCMGYECEICRNWYGETDENKHTNYTYTASGNTITETCDLCKAYSGTLTISAPADLYADGTTAKEAVVDNQLADTSVTYEVIYSTADGSAPKTAGTYTASVTLGDATASVEFTLLNYAASVTDKDGKLIGNYTTFADAITAASASEGSTLTLLDDITLTAIQYISSGKLTLDLNGKTLFNETATTLRIESGADVTIKDSGKGGTVKSNAASSSAILNNGTLTIESGNIISENKAVNNNRTLTVNGGSFEGKKYALYISKGTTEIYGGEFNGTVWGFAPYTINDGDFTAELIGINCEGGVLTVNGGTFDIDEIKIYKGTVSLKGGEFKNGFTVHDLKYDSDAEKFAATILADGYYYKDADGKIITVANNATAISGYVKVAKGADFANDAVITLSQTEYEYNGGENKPAVTVTVGGKTLDSANYSVSYADNINAGTATVTVTAVESDIYSGTATANFTITKADASVTAPAANTLTYNGSAQALITAGSVNVGEIQYSTDGVEYSATIPTATNAGYYTVYYKVVGDANYNDTEPATVSVTIKTKDISDAFIILGDALTYTGEEQTQNVTTVEIPDDLDVTYNISGNKATNVGVYLLTVTGNGNFSGEAKIAYEIAVDVSGIDGITPLNVKSSDKAKIEYVYNQLDNAVTDLADDAKKAEWDNLKSDCIELLKMIESVADKLESFKNKLVEYDIDTVTSDDADDLESFYNEVAQVYNDYFDNLTEAETKEFDNILSGISAFQKRISDIAKEITRITNAVNGYDKTTVKSSDKADLEQLIADINALTTGKNITDSERADLLALADTVNDLLTVISDTATEIKRITDAVDAYDIETVTSADKADLEQLIDDIKALTDGDNITDAEREQLNGNETTLIALGNKIAETADEIARIENAVNGYDEVSVKSSDKADIEQLLADIKDLTDGQNITDEERTNLENLDATADALLAKIAETMSEYDRVIAAANGYDEATVTSADKDALVQLNEDIYALALTDNVTAEEIENLENAHDKVLGLLDKLTGISDEIKRIIEAVDEYVFESVKSSDKADIQQLIADIKALLDTQNITADERTLLEGADETCDKLIAKIDETVAEINRINDATNAYDIDTVTSADKADIEKLLADIKALTDGDNITDTEREQLDGNETTLSALLDKIGATADEITRIENAVNSYDETTVKSTDKADLEQLIEDIKALTDATNVTAEEKAKLAELDAKVDSLIKKIDDTAAEIARIDEAVNAYDEETVKSSDEEAINKLKEDIQTLIDSGNVTEEEIAALEETKADADALTDKIDETQAEIDRINDAVNSYTEDTVKSTDTEAIEQLKEDIQALIDSGNVTEEEIAALEDTKADADALTDKITETEEQLEEIKGIENNYNPENVSSDDKADIEAAIAEIEAVNPDNLTDEQKAEYEEIKAEFEALLNEIEAAEKSVADIGVELEMFDEDRVTIFWEDDIEALKAKIDELLADENMGTAEKAKLNEYKAQAEKLIEIINTPKEYFSLRFFYLIWDCLTWKYNGILWLFKQIFAF